MAIRGVIFDLDDTLYDCSGQLTDPARRRAAKCLSRQSTLSPSELFSLQSDLAGELGSADAIREIGRREQLPGDIIESALKAYNRDVAESITPFEDTPSTLDELCDRGYKLALVTTGTPNRQRQKIQQLDFAKYFSESDGTLVIHDDRLLPDKGPALATTGANLDLSFDQILAVGDKLDAEISAANKLGMVTARFLHGRQKNRVPKTKDERPDHSLENISDLLKILA